MIQVPESLVKRNEERVERLVRRKEEESDREKQTDIFRETFHTKQVEIEQLLDSLDLLKLDRQQLAEQFNQIYKLIQVLNKYLSTSSIFLIAYDLRTSKQVIQELQERAASEESRRLPKRKFGFSKANREKKKEADKIIINDGDVVDFVSKKHDKERPFETGFSNRKNERLILHREDLIGKDVILENLEKCDVLLLGPLNTLQVSRISECRLLTGPASTSVLLEGCQSSVCAFSCQQLRVHQTTDTDFYIHVTTKAIIEDSSRIRFAPYTFSYQGIAEDMKYSGLNTELNNWDKIDDFNWLVNNKQSPNWSLLEENDRLKLTY